MQLKTMSSMNWSWAQRVVTICTVLVVGVAAGWWLRSETLNDDYQPLAPMHRPKSVPRYALWIGGADGGSYIDCHENTTSGYDDCTVYNDWTGDVVASGHYVLDGKNRAANSTELKYSFFDGQRIFLDLPPVDDRIPSLMPTNH
jgi:hypothetical protein